MKIYKFKDFLVESVKDNMPDCGWKKITSTQFYAELSIANYESEKLIEEELDYLNQFIEEHGLVNVEIWDSGAKIKFDISNEYRITILKSREEWFLVSVINLSSFYQIDEFYIVDQNGLRESNYGLKDLLNNIINI